MKAHLPCMERAGTGSRPSAKSSPRTPGARGVGGVGQKVDLLAGVALTFVAVFAVVFLPAGSLLRAFLAAPVLFVVPGYLLIQALVVPAASIRSRVVHGLVALGVSPGVVGLLALSTAVVDGGFRPIPIVTVVTVASLLFAGIALYRRSARLASPSRAHVSRLASDES